VILGKVVRSYEIIAEIANAHQGEVENLKSLIKVEQMG